MRGIEIEQLISLLSKLPGLGPRSGRRAALHLLKKREQLMTPLIQALTTANNVVVTCDACGNLDTTSPCQICTDPRRDTSLLCVVADVADIWALERTAIFKGHYHVLGGVLSALDGVQPDDLRIDSLVARLDGTYSEVILALDGTVDGQTTCHYILDVLETKEVKVTRLAHGVPIGGELEYIDDGTLATALNSRRTMAE